MSFALKWVLMHVCLPHLEVLSRYFQYVKALGFEAEPNYDHLRKMFRETLVRRKE